MFSLVTVVGTDIVYGPDGFPISGTIQSVATAVETLQASAAFSQVTGSDLDDIIVMATDDEFPFGTSVDAGAGDDLVIGTVAEDEFRGGAGNDTLRGAEGEDVLTGDAGNDVIFGGAGDDQIFGDEALGQSPEADAGNDILFGGAGNDLMRGGGGQDILFGGAGQDNIVGDAGNDLIFGGAGDDVIFGDAGNDFIQGIAGDDLVFGGTGDDFLAAGTGTDTLIGGAGADTFLFVATAPDPLTPVTQAAIVRDFALAEDLLYFDFFGTQPTPEEMFATFLDQAQQVGDDIVVTFSTDFRVTLQDVELADLTVDHFALL